MSAKLAGEAARHLMMSSMASRRLAFIGLGNMGLPMAKNLAKAHAVTVFDASPKTLEVAKADGLTVAASLEAAVKEADAVVTMLPNGAIASKVYMGDGSAPGLFSSLAAGTDCLDCSTIDVGTAQQLAAAAGDRGLCYMDTPVSGGVAAAAGAKLSFMCGGAPDAFERAKPLLGAMGPNQFLAGPAGSGQVAKACNNMLLAIHMIGTSEALSMGARSGLDPAALSEIFKASSGRNWSVEVYNPYPGVLPTAPSSNGYAPGFMVDLMAKDLGLAMEVAKTAGIDLPMGGLAARMYADHQQAGNGTRDFSSICENYRA